MLECALITEDLVPHFRMESSQHVHHFFWFGGLSEGREAAQVTIDRGDIAPMAFQQLLVLGRQDRLGELRREETLEPDQAFHLCELLIYPLLELSVPLRELDGLYLYRVM